MHHQKQPAAMRLYTKEGQRLYVNKAEREAFIQAAQCMPPIPRLLCLTLVYTGCRLSEARFMRPEDFQTNTGRVSFRTLKRRRSGMIREVPIPKQLIAAFHDLQSDQ